MTARQPGRDKRRNRVRHVAGRPINYADPADFPLAAEVQRIRRGSTDHRYVIAGFRITDHAVVMHAIEQGPAYNITGRLTTDHRHFRRWRTKQAANEWMRRHPHCSDLHVWSLSNLDVLTQPPQLD